LGMLITMVTLPNWRKETTQVPKAWGPKGKDSMHIKA
jgi:hypothetical protein